MPPSSILFTPNIFFLNANHSKQQKSLKTYHWNQNSSSIKEMKIRRSNSSTKAFFSVFIFHFFSSCRSPYLQYVVHAISLTITLNRFCCWLTVYLMLLLVKRTIVCIETTFLYHLFTLSLVQHCEWWERGRKSTRNKRKMPARIKRFYEPCFLEFLLCFTFITILINFSLVPRHCICSSCN